MQDLLNEENGGLKDADIENFETGEPEFIDRSVFDPNFENAEDYTINLLRNRTEKAIFSLPEAMSLLKTFDIVIK